MKKLLVTGGAGFIGCHFVRKALKNNYIVAVLDKLTYSGNLDNLADVANNSSYNFYLGDINDSELVSKILEDFQPNAIINFAAETHVDNSITGPAPFITTNINGLFNILNCSLRYYQSLSSQAQTRFRVIQISTDEVYGSLNFDMPAFTTTSNYAPNSPYSASKAAGDHLARAWFETYKLPVIITNCSNNYGPYQHAEKLIPKTILNAIQGNQIPVYGKGENVRDWIHAQDHVAGVLLALEKGIPGEKYLFGGNNELSNIELVKLICKILKDITGDNFEHLITYTKDRLGHDLRYAINPDNAFEKLGFVPKHNLVDGLAETVKWYIQQIND